MISSKDKNVLLIKVEGPKPKCTKVLLYNLEISIPRTVEYLTWNISIRFKSAFWRHLRYTDVPKFDCVSKA